jgi:hypothetical protein
MPEYDYETPDPEMINKAGRGVGFSGGGDGGGGGGTLGGLSGSGFHNPFTGGRARGAGIGRGRMSMMGGRPLRLPSDNIPAWLSEGEFVMNPVSSSMFGPELEQMNEMGNTMRSPQEFAYGGPVRNPFDDADGYGFGGWLKKNIGWVAPLAIAAAPLAIGAMGAGGAGAAAGGGAAGASGAASGAGGALTAGPMAAVPATQHFGYGASFLGQHGGLGGVLKSAAPYAASALNASNVGGEEEPSGYQQRLQYFMQQRQQPMGYATGGWAGMGMRRPASPFRQPPQIGQQPQNPGSFTLPGIGSSGRDSQGFVGTYDPKNPWAHRTGNVNPGALGDLHRMVGQYGQQGFYGPGGSPQAREAMRNQAMSDARGFGEQAYLSANVGGMDPAAAAAYRSMALSSAGRGVGDAMTRYNADLAMQEQAYARDLMNQMAGWDYDSARAQRDFNFAKNLPKK